MCGCGRERASIRALLGVAVLGLWNVSGGSGSGLGGLPVVGVWDGNRLGYWRHLADVDVGTAGSSRDVIEVFAREFFCRERLCGFFLSGLFGHAGLLG